jgi:glucose 1-dehydrogenase
MSPPPPSLSLKGKCAVITGASTGIGRAIALAYAAAGANVVINHAPDQPCPDELLAEINAASGGRAVAVQADISDLASHDELLNTAQARFGNIDILVNNAGRQAKIKVFEVTPEAWERVMSINLRGPYFLALAVAKRMVAAGTKGRIINVTSTHETKPLWGCSIYSISKSGLGMVTKSLALELARHDITVNSLIPGAYNTPMNPATPERVKLAQTKLPLRRLGEPVDITGAALFLASDHSAYMTGASIKIDGGLSL